MLTFNIDGMVAQRFPFPAPIMDYILKNLQPQHLIKLYQSCKFFYDKYGLNIIQNLVIVDDFDEEETFNPTSTIICASNPALKKLKDFWISDSFVYSAPLNMIIMPSFSHCTIKKMNAGYHLAWEEYEALTKAGTVQDLKIGLIYDDDANLVSIDKIIAQVPNATSIEITESILASKSFASLAFSDHKAKISNFVLNNIDDPEKFNIDLLFEFLSKNGETDCEVQFDFDMDFYDIDDERIDELKRMGIEYTNIIAEKLQAKKQKLALEESVLMP